MNEDLQKKLIEWVEKLGDIASEQLPDFAQQIIAYTIWNANIWMWVGIAFLIFLGFLFFIPMLIFIFDKDEREITGTCMFWIVLFSIILLFVIFSHYSTIKKCEVAPKLVLIDFIRNK